MSSVLHTQFYPCTGSKSVPQPLVLIHGWGNDSRVWQLLLPLMVEHLDVIALDLPGFGKSQPCESWQRAVELMAAALPERCALLGWSLGGMLGVQLAAQYPERVSKLITIASNGVFVRRSGWDDAMAVEASADFSRSFAADPLAAMKQFTALEAMGDVEEKKLLRWLRQNMAEIDSQSWLQALAWLNELDNRQALATLKTPVLHLLAEKDQLVPVSAADAIAVLNPAARTAVVAGSGHAPQISQPETVATWVLDFLVAPAVDPYGLRKELIAASFGKAADSYDAFAQLQREVGEELLALLPGVAPTVVGASPQGELACSAKRGPPGGAGDGLCRDLASRAGSHKEVYLPDDWQPDAIADMGCGTGHFAAALAQRFPEATCLGVDLAEGMVAFARDHHHSVANLDWLCADAEALPLAGGRFDLIFSNFAFQWSQNLNGLMAEQWRLLRPGGWVLFTTVGPGTLAELRRAWQAVDRYVHVNQFLPLNQVNDSLNAAGFTIEHWQEQTLVRHYPQLSALTRELKAIGAHNVNTGRNTGLTGRKHIEALKEAYENFRTPAGLPSTWEILYVAARKV